MTGLLLMQRKLLRNLFLLKLKRQMPGQKGEVQLVSYITSTFFRRIIPKLLQPAREGVYQVFKFDLVELAMLDNNIVVYQFIQDLHFFVTGGDDENELILSAVLQGFFDAVGLLLRSNVDKREALENLDLILLCLDEIVDGGMVLETDANVIAGKVASHSIDAAAPLSEQTLTQALATAREHLKRSLLK